MVFIVREYPTGFDHIATETVYNSFYEANKYACALANRQGVDISIKIYEATNEFATKRKLLKQW